MKVNKDIRLWPIVGDAVIVSWCVAGLITGGNPDWLVWLLVVFGVWCLVEAIGKVVRRELALADLRRAVDQTADGADQGEDDPYYPWRAMDKPGPY